MKKYNILFGVLLLCNTSFAYSFKAPNERGDSLAFDILSDGNVAMTFDVKVLNTIDSTYKYLTCDTLFVPEQVTHGGKTYRVTTIGTHAFTQMTPRVKVTVLPSSIDSIPYDQRRLALSAFADNHLQSIIIDKSNSRYKIQNRCLLPADGKLLLAYPTQNREDSLFIPEGVEEIGHFALEGAIHLKYIELPLTTKTIGLSAFSEVDSVRRLIIKDSVETLAMAALDCYGLRELTLGTSVREVHNDFVVTDSVLDIYCRTIVPPTIASYNANTFLKDILARGSRLLVPQKSIKAYKQADGWSQFGDNIFPIEPPIMATDEGVTISWVQSFSATGYVWYMYQDAAHTQLVMSLTFDQDGRLTEMAFGPAFGSGTQQAPARRADEDGEENAERFAEYYSFTIRNLSAKTDYYYTRQTLSGEEVIDSEDGTFNTDPDHVPTANGMLTLPESATKTLQDGNVVIIRNGKRYHLNGTEVK